MTRHARNGAHECAPYGGQTLKNAAGALSLATRFHGKSVVKISRPTGEKTMSRAVTENMATKADLSALEQRITIRLGGLIVAGVGILAALIKLF